MTGTGSGEADVTRVSDPVDQRLVVLLMADGRSTLKTLAEATGLSVSAVQARVRRLEATGVIRGYRADVDLEAMGLPLSALVAVTPRDADREYEIPDRLRALPEIEACYSVAGEDSFVLLVRVATPRALEELIREIRRRAAVSTRTTVVLQTLFEHETSLDHVEKNNSGQI